MSDYRVDIKVRNNVFLYRLEKAGYTSVGELCRLNGKMKYVSCIGSVINMTESPFQSDGDWKSAIIWCAEKLSCSPEDLFNESQLQTILKSNKRHVNVSEAEMIFMIERDNNVLSLEDFSKKQELENIIEEQLNSLTPIEQRIINMRYGLGDIVEPLTLDECGEVIGASGARVRQIEQKALRKLRHPKKSEIMRECLE